MDCPPFLLVTRDTFSSDLLVYASLTAQGWVLKTWWVLWRRIGNTQGPKWAGVSKCFRRGIASKSNQKVLLDLMIQAVLTQKSGKQAPLSCSPQQLQRFAFPRKVYKFPISPRAPRHLLCQNSPCFDNSHPDRWERTSHYGFESHFPDDECCWHFFISLLVICMSSMEKLKAERPNDPAITSGYLFREMNPVLQGFAPPCSLQH